ncbi:putative Rossmann fold nucleotide-binding protein involved in DNA uptake [Neobacillus bataviensis LMG 21833]|uniref:Putative Rossmann fold nucleotide-binding protein involved in DNA uptake n=1 Tax=Neobacillus bataviensis LMG 21833 TaxID=1117379 RepID=K6DTG8_9BACI|nr:DNA-processing protein DprA [Neobacillus bataviensis]EKN64076.1 putative Rossmann fold nucleotide-binding protein involved in DNA uptake [Neobacillus bataviensis LMG 21833]
MDDFKERLVHLLHYPNISWNTVYQMLKKDPTLQSLYRLQTPSPQQISLFPPINHDCSLTQSSIISLHPDIIHEQIRQYETNDITVITILDKEYPRYLKEIYQPPWALFTKGDISLLEKEPKLAVVGSRQASPYGRNAMRLIFPELIHNGVLIVSGLAKGIDALAHEYAIKNGGNTIAVIAGGLYHIYPKENLGLALQLMNTQLVVSEYPPDTKPLRWHFPARNRIISGLAAGTFIIEAKRKSGSLITANYAVNEGRDVFSLPGSIFNPYSIGANDLIQQGAKLVTRAEDILEELRLNSR